MLGIQLVSPFFPSFVAVYELELIALPEQSALITRQAGVGNPEFSDSKRDTAHYRRHSSSNLFLNSNPNQDSIHCGGRKRLLVHAWLVEPPHSRADRQNEPPTNATVVGVRSSLQLTRIRGYNYEFSFAISPKLGVPFLRLAKRVQLFPISDD